LYVPSKLVLKTTSTFFFDVSTDASAQQSMIKSYLGKLPTALLLDISILKFLIFFFFYL